MCKVLNVRQVSRGGIVRLISVPCSAPGRQADTRALRGARRSSSRRPPDIRPRSGGQGAAWPRAEGRPLPAASTSIRPCALRWVSPQTAAGLGIRIE